MKKISLFAAIFIFLTIQLFAQIDLDEHILNGSTLLNFENTTYVYEVDYYGIKYDFIVTVKSLSDGITFDYEMTNAAKTKGTIIMTKEALENAVNQYNHFQGGEKKLTDATTVWVSKKVFNDLVEKGEAVISPDGGKTMVTIGGATPLHDFTMHNAKSDEKMDDISHIYAESEDGKIKYRIHMSEYHPLILKMDLGWTITLKELR